jgi:hypothetical protein
VSGHPLGCRENCCAPGFSRAYARFGSRLCENPDPISVSVTTRTQGSGGRKVEDLFVVDPEWEQNNIQSGLGSGEGLIFHVRDEVVKAGEDGELRTVDPGVHDKRIMLVVEEFAGALQVMERPGNTLSPVLRDAWGTAKLQTLTKNSPIKATDSHVSLIAHVTDHELRAVLNRTEMANGFANRILFARIKRSKLLPHGGHLDEKMWQGLAQVVELADWNGDRGPFSGQNRKRFGASSRGLVTL